MPPAKEALPLADERPERCETCRFWQHYDSGEEDEIQSGLCRRLPPYLPLMHGQVRLQEQDGVWPSTDNLDWCGEWQPKGGAEKTSTTVTIPTTEQLKAALVRMPVRDRLAIGLRYGFSTGVALSLADAAKAAKTTKSMLRSQEENGKKFLDVVCPGWQYLRCEPIDPPTE